ncbi:MAG: hypothetical protein WC595_03505 [Candidatus Nanoarchaeia archaeon]
MKKDMVVSPLNLLSKSTKYSEYEFEGRKVYLFVRANIPKEEAEGFAKILISVCTSYKFARGFANLTVVYFPHYSDEGLQMYKYEKVRKEYYGQSIVFVLENPECRLRDIKEALITEITFLWEEQTFNIITFQKEYRKKLKGALEKRNTLLFHKKELDAFQATRYLLGDCFQDFFSQGLAEYCAVLEGSKFGWDFSERWWSDNYQTEATSAVTVVDEYLTFLKGLNQLDKAKGEDSPVTGIFRSMISGLKRDYYDREIKEARERGYPQTKLEEVRGVSYFGALIHRSKERSAQSILIHVGGSSFFSGLRGLPPHAGAHMIYTILYSNSDWTIEKLAKMKPLRFIQLYESSVDTLSRKFETTRKRKINPIVSVSSGKGIIDYSWMLKQLQREEVRSRGN